MQDTETIQDCWIYEIRRREGRPEDQAEQRPTGEMKLKTRGWHQYWLAVESNIGEMRKSRVQCILVYSFPVINFFSLG
jgi:hypothetical protein